MDNIVVESRPQMDRPIMVVAFRGWNDAGDAASTAADFMVETWGARRFAHIDPEEFYDFQVTRPTVGLESGTTRKIEWPENAFWHARVNGRDVVLFVGIEPNLRWKTFSHQMVGVAKEFGATKLITLGAFLADVPHTRKVPVVGSAGNPEEAETLGLAGSSYEGPTGIVGVVHELAIRSSLPSVSFWAAVPHYVPSGENPKAALALAKRFCSFAELTLDVSELEPQAQAWEDSVSEQVRENEALTDYIQGLEESGNDLELELSSGVDGLAEEIEKFLEQGGGEH